MTTNRKKKQRQNQFFEIIIKMMNIQQDREIEKNMIQKDTDVLYIQREKEKQNKLSEIEEEIHHSCYHYSKNNKTI